MIVQGVINFNESLIRLHLMVFGFGFVILISGQDLHLRIRQSHAVPLLSA